MNFYFKLLPGERLWMVLSFGEFTGGYLNEPGADVEVLNQQPVSFYSITAVRRMGLTAPPSLSNTSPATPAVSPAWMGPSSPRCPCLRRNHLDPLSAPSTQGGSEATAPPAPPMSRPSTSAPLKRCTMAASASPTCPRTTRTRHWPCRCPLCTAPCWGTPSEDDLRISTPTPEPSALRCDLADSVLADLPALRPNQRSDGAVEAQLMESQTPLLRQGLKWSVKTVIGLISVYSMLTEVTSTVDWRAAVTFWPLHAPEKTVNVDCYVFLLDEGCCFAIFLSKHPERKGIFFSNPAAMEA